MFIKKILILFLILSSSSSYALTIRERLQRKLDAQAKAREKRAQKKPSELAAEQMVKIKTEGFSAVSGLKDSVKGLSQEEIAKEQGVEYKDEFSKLKASMLVNEKIDEVKQVGQEEKLNGALEKIKYQIIYENGNVDEVELIYIKPSISGPFELVDVKTK